MTDTLDLSLAASDYDRATVLHMTRLLSHNGPSYIAGERAEYIEANKMRHVRSVLMPRRSSADPKPGKPHALGKLHLPGDLEAQIEAFVEHCNHRPKYEALSNVTPVDAYFGGLLPSSNSAKGSSDRPSNIGACNTASSPPLTQA